MCFEFVDRFRESFVGQVRQRYIDRAVKGDDRRDRFGVRGAGDSERKSAAARNVLFFRDKRCGQSTEECFDLDIARFRLERAFCPVVECAGDREREVVDRERRFLDAEIAGGQVACDFVLEQNGDAAHLHRFLADECRYIADFQYSCGTQRGKILADVEREPLIDVLNEETEVFSGTVEFQCTVIYADIFERDRKRK